MAPPHSNAPPASGPDGLELPYVCFTLVLNVPPGEHAFKFLVDGLWCTDDTSRYPVRLSPDGVRHHLLQVSAVIQVPTRSPPLTMARLAEADPRNTTVFRSASASAVPCMRVPPGPSSSTSLHDVQRRTVELATRGSSFNAPPPANSISATANANRKSLLMRVGSNWMKRFSSRGDDFDRFSGMDQSFGSADRSTSGIFRGRDRGSLFQSASEPNVGMRDVDKENSFRRNGITGDRGITKRGTLRGSGRAAAVKVSMPTKVDEPKDLAEVNRQSDNWRQMARHLQDDLFDPTGARKLFLKAIHHREKHGLWFSGPNAQVHVDLARNYSRSDQIQDAELHLRIALDIYENIEAGPEHVADLLLYVGVVVDRQKRRSEAERYYRNALLMYKENKVQGNNVEIAVKNLTLNLRKQDREVEVDEVRREFLGLKGSSVIV